MKIYNKKKFYSGMVFLILAILNLGALLFIENDIKGIVVTLMLFLVSIIDVYRSTSKKYSMEDRINENDERNRLMYLK